MSRKRPQMILARQFEPEAETPPETPPVSEAAAVPEEPEETSAPPIDVGRVAERVYQLMREDLAIERLRRGWK